MLIKALMTAQGAFLNLMSFLIIGIIGGVLFSLLLGDSKRRYARNMEIAIGTAILGGIFAFFLPVLSPHEFLAAVGFSSLIMTISLFIYWIGFRDQSPVGGET